MRKVLGSKILIIEIKYVSMLRHSKFRNGNITERTTGNHYIYNIIYIM